MESATSPPPHSYTVTEIDLGSTNTRERQDHSFQTSESHSAYTRSTYSSLPSIDDVIIDELHAVQYYPLPAKCHNHIWRRLRYKIFSVYHRLSLFVLILNGSIIVVFFTVRGLHGVSSHTMITAAAINLTVAVLIRQEIVINALFSIIGRCPQRMPLRVKKLAGKIYHLGGVHSGAGVASAVWFAVANYPILTLPISKVSVVMHRLNVVVTLMLDLLLFIIVVMSHPHLRRTMHNIWEASHRYAGWSAVVLFWLHMLINIEATRWLERSNQTIAQAVIRNPVFWLLVVVTISILIPWLRLRKVDVVAEVLSGHAIRLHFNYTDIPSCATIRFSTSPLREWHSFAGIPDWEGHGFLILVSRAGDWTSRIIEKPPRQLWTRGFPTQSVLHVARLFQRVVVLATGSGIGPVLSLLHASDLDTRVIWSASDPINTYRRKIVNQVLSADRHAIIIDTRQAGRPDLVREAYHLYRSSRAEAVFVVSNAKVTRMLVYALESRGVPIFAPIFDS